MERALIEARTRKIISFMKNKNLANLLEKNISMFSDEDLTKVLEFLETWDDSVLVNFLMEKTKQFMAEAEKVKQAKSKIKKFKIFLKFKKKILWNTKAMSLEKNI